MKKYYLILIVIIFFVPWIVLSQIGTSPAFEIGGSRYPTVTDIEVTVNEYGTQVAISAKATDISGVALVQAGVSLLNGTQKIAPISMDSADNDRYTIVIDISGIASGTYNADIIATDTIGGQGHIGTYHHEFTKLKGNTYLSMTASPSSAVAGTDVTLSATLRYTLGGAPVVGQTVIFSDSVGNIGSAVTNASGTTSVDVNYHVPLSATPGNHTITATFVTNDYGYGSTTTYGLTVTAPDGNCVPHNGVTICGTVSTHINSTCQ